MSRTFLGTPAFPEAARSALADPQLRQRAGVRVVHLAEVLASTEASAREVAS